ncbi:ABC transporter permease [Streptomyces sp. NPDC096152]|uniref:ABC transporter permease n=1 Tax=Streptomyces sp. NPDC096152 TaxID=3366078 RepID=UPI0038114A75
MTFWEYLDSRRALLLAEAGGHAGLVLPCVAAGAVLGVLVGVVAHRGERAAHLAATAARTLLAVPSLALIGLLVAVLGLGLPPTLTALTFLGLLPVARNTVRGLHTVGSSPVDAARGLGMSRQVRLLRVELPLAWPPILDGVRTATRQLTGIAAVAAYVSAPGLGNEIFRGLTAPDSADAPAQILAGTLGIAALTLLFDAVLVLLGRLTVRRGRVA